MQINFITSPSYNKPQLNTQQKITFGKNLNEQKLLNGLKKNTYKSMQAYISAILKNITNLSPDEIENIAEVGVNYAKKADKQTFYNFYTRILQEIMQTRKTIQPNKQGNWYSDMTSKIIGENNRFKPNINYLDIGCGNCRRTKAITDKMGINPRNTYGIDFLKPMQLFGINRQKFNGVNVPTTIPRAHFTTIFNVLHHIKTKEDAIKLLSSVHNHVKDGGLLLIRELEIKETDDKKFWKFAHDFKSRIIKTNPENLDNGTLYLPSQEWENILNKIGFEKLKMNYDNDYNGKTSYFMLLKKQLK